MGLGSQHPPRAKAYLERLQARPAFKAARQRQKSASAAA
jgi:glutathione S-transferase